MKVITRMSFNEFAKVFETIQLAVDFAVRSHVAFAVVDDATTMMIAIGKQ